ncbi:MAG: hypothetical protein IPP02_08265, partial [Chitinophagaceae bacterium]|nr:hypothetical protein [Chitinophagaceae bacterium]
MIATTSATNSGSTHNTITANSGTNQNDNDMSTATMHRSAQAAATAHSPQKLCTAFLPPAIAGDFCFVW